MPSPSFAADLARYGPQTGGAAGQPAGTAPSLDEASAYCRRLAATHYENFTVASWLLPRALRRHFAHLYAYCRWADDLADEVDDRARAAGLLDWWEAQLETCYEGRAVHPVFVALQPTIREFSIPPQPFRDLLSAFRQDQSRCRYATRADLDDYCRRSANPVGHLVLYLARAFDRERAALADCVCMGLQLTNFCQDVAEDWYRGRLYLPEETLARHGSSERDVARCCEQAAPPVPALRAALADEVARARGLLVAGLGLVERMPRQFRVQVALFAHGGLAVLERIERADYDVWQRRPALGKAAKLAIFARQWCRYTWGPGASRERVEASPPCRLEVPG
ncbi:MAG: squalene synthase HpnC [Pirellulales bacterium]|nr:squalene synthase HpnC [Pirellulales bacterium]